MTEAKAEANRQNAQCSTGPRTDKGKSRSRMNAIRHGVLSRQVVLASESREEFDAARDAIVESLAPQGQIEVELATLAVMHLWRVRRVLAAETAAIDEAFRDSTDDMNDIAGAFSAAGVRLERLGIYEGQVSKRFHRAIEVLRLLQRDRLAPATIGAASVPDSSWLRSRSSRICHASARSMRGGPRHDQVQPAAPGSNHHGDGLPLGEPEQDPGR